MRDALAVALVLLLVAGAFAIPTGSVSGTGGHPTTGGYSISVAATEDYGYSPDTFEAVPTHTNITVTFTDESEMGAHTFTIIGKQGWQIPSSYSQSQIDALAYGHNPPALFEVNVSYLGDVETKSFTSPGVGWYEFVCTVSGHFQNGMYGFIAFGENLPTNLTLPNSRTNVGGSNFSAFDAVVAAGVVVAVLLLLVFWTRRRAEHRRALSLTRPPRATPPTAAGTQVREGKRAP